MSENYKNLALVTAVAWLLIGIMVTGALCSQSGCSSAQDNVAVEQQGSFDNSDPWWSEVKKTITTGNHSWLPNERGLLPNGEISGRDAQDILNILDCFERHHPEYEITGWRLEIRHRSYVYDSVIYGIWIDHRLKPGYVEEYQAGGYPTGRYVKQEEQK